MNVMLIEDAMGSWLLLVGRIALASVFLVSGIHKAFWYPKAVEEFKFDRIPWIPLALPATIVLHLLGSICLIVGYQTQIAALLLAVFTALATLKVHAFWRLPEAEQLVRSRVANANLGVVGGLLVLAAAGPGILAVQL
jgi:putative oxidoreductase